MNQSIKSEESHKDIETLLAFAWIIIERGKEGEKKEELEVVCKVPGPWQASVIGRPRYKIVQKHQMPQPMIAALSCGFIHVE